jgi:hypothetical protein
VFNDLFDIEAVRRYWSQSKWYRRVLKLAILYLIVRLTVQAVIVAQVLAAGPVGSEVTLISNDLQIYMAAADRLQHQEELYLQEALDRVAVFQYAPAYALFFTLFLPIPFGLLSLGHTLLNIGAYVLLYFWWGRIFRRLGLQQAHEMLAWTLPVWLVFAGFWGDLAYLNIYVITALWMTLLIEAVLEERAGWAVLWILLLLLTKPYLACPLAIPLILGQTRFFFKLLGLSLISLGAVIGLTILLMGPAYGWQQHVAYGRFLAEMVENFPWRGPESGFLGYNHSILQITYYLLGVTPAALRLALTIKLLLLAPLAVVSLRHWLRPARLAGWEAPRLSLDFAFALYLGAFIWLDIVWEQTLGVAILAYLLATLEQRRSKILALTIFLSYALLDFWQFITFVFLGPDIIAPDLYIWTDPSIYVPVVMVVILTFYGILVKRLWHVPATLSLNVGIKSDRLSTTFSQ